MLTKNSFSKYLLYAIGEIVLIAIGILIALSLNNWNENRKAQDTELKILIGLKEEFQANYRYLQGYTLRMQDFRSRWDSFLTTISNKHLAPEKRAIERPKTNYRPYTISNSILNSILTTGKIDNLNNDSLKYMLILWVDTIKHYQKLEQLHTDFFNNDIMPFERTLFLSTINNRLFDYHYPFPSSDKKKELYLKANDDMIYQNFLLYNFYWLNTKLSKLTGMEEEMSQIIQLLKKEIELKQMEH